MPPSADGACRGTPAEARAAIERFLKSSRQPVLLEPGEDRYALAEGSYAVESRGGRLTIQAWDRARNLVRRVTGVKDEKPGRLELSIEKFAKRKGRLLLIDLARPANAAAGVREKRLGFREQFRGFLSREFPDWKLAELSTETDLEHSLSPAYPRALLRRGQSGMAVLGCPPEAGDASCALSFGLIWLDYLRRRERRLALETLALFLPQGRERTTCLRMRFLNPQGVQCAAFVYAPDGRTERLDLADFGNLDTRLDPCRAVPCPAGGALESWIERLCRNPHVERISRAGGEVVLRVRGLVFARTAGDRLLFGIDRASPASVSDLPEIEDLAAELARMRAPDAADRDNPLYLRHPEQWLESQVRANLEQVDASLLPFPVYGQVPAFAAGERGVIDLLAVDRSGRLAVLELKASEDLHLPLQALDYWMRVQWHLDRGDFLSCGYFPGVALVKTPPRLLLIAPALAFHPTSEAILRFLAPAVEVERIGLGVEWRKRLQVMFRMCGAQRPA